MNLLFLLAFGAICGGIAKAIVPGKCPAGWLPTIALGVVGSFVGGHLAGFIGSVVGACVVLYVYSIWSDDR
jgi:uncharacterized membrane protein YeaQ/YmgE (transglycosylase-associated protein family)